MTERPSMHEAVAAAMDQGRAERPPQPNPYAVGQSRLAGLAERAEADESGQVWAGLSPADQQRVATWIERRDRLADQKGS